MKYNKELFKSVAILIVFVVIVVVAGIFYSKNKDIKKVSQNKLAEFVANLAANEFPAPEVEFTDPEHNLSVLNYWNSQETEAYAVYDSTNDILYKFVAYGSGGDYGDDAAFDIPKAFVGVDKLLISTNYDEKLNTIKNSLIIRDFNGKIIKKLPDGLQLKSPISKKYGDAIVLDTNKGVFSLDSKTLELTPVKIKYDISTWKEYKNDELGLSFMYPNDFSVDDMSSIMSVEKGGVIAKSFFKKDNPNSTQDFYFVAASKDYIPGGQEGNYPTTKGWDELYNKSYIVDKPIQAQDTLVHIFRSKDPKGDEDCEACAGFSLGYRLGVVIDTKNKKYPGIALEMPDTELSRQILKTVKIY